jgi:hypothetical protein
MHIPGQPGPQDSFFHSFRPIANAADARAASGALLGAAKARDDRKRTDGGN